MNVALTMTAVAHGATAANHVEVIDLIKEKNEQGEESICGAIVRDTLTGNSWTVKAKVY
jgi:glycerol-3-phosphate dehydrogenase